MNRSLIRTSHDDPSSYRRKHLFEPKKPHRFGMLVCIDNS
jgi:hypothetical protein